MFEFTKINSEIFQHFCDFFLIVSECNDQLFDNKLFISIVHRQTPISKLYSLHGLRTINYRYYPLFYLQL